MKKNAKNDRLYIRISPEDYATIAEKAAAVGESLSDYVRTAALESKRGKRRGRPPKKVAPLCCGNCGAPLAENALFCGCCGQSALL